MPVAAVPAAADAPFAAAVTYRGGRKPGALSKVTYLKMDFLRELFRESPSMKSKDVAARVTEKFGQTVGSDLIATIRRDEFGVVLLPGGRSLKVAKGEPADITTVSGGGMPQQQKELANGTSSTEAQLAFAAAALEDPSKSVAEVMRLIEKKFAKPIHSYHLYKIAKQVRGKPGGRAQPKTRAAAPTEGHEEVRRLVGELRAAMREEHVDHLVIPLEGPVQMRRAVVQELDL